MDLTSTKPAPLSPPMTTGEAKPLRDHVLEAIKRYFAQLGDQKPTNLYDLVVSEVEAPLLEAVLIKARGNQSKSAIMLGISRGTLRKLLKRYNLL